MCQEWPVSRYEVIVVDDGSTDHTARVADEYTHTSEGRGPQVRYVRQPHGGLNRARNTALRVAHGDPICFVDDDEELPTTWLRAIVEGAQQFPTAGALGGPMRLRLEGTPPRMCGREPLGESELDLGAEAREVEEVWGGNLAVRRWAVDRIGGFRADLRLLGGTEIEWERRLQRAGFTVVYLPDAWLWHRRTAADLRLRRLMINRFFRGRGQAVNAHLQGRPLDRRMFQRELRAEVAHAAKARCAVGLITAAQHGGRLVGIVESRLRRRT